MRACGEVAGPSSSTGIWRCPFKNYHSCKDGLPGYKGYSRLLMHIQRDHFNGKERRDQLKEHLASDLDLHNDVVDTLRVLKNWLCGECMVLHALNRFCWHGKEVVKCTSRAEGDIDFIVGIPQPRDPQVNLGSGPFGTFVVDVALLERVLALPVATVKSIPPACRMAFAQALSRGLQKVVDAPGSIEAWVKLLLLPRCTLRVVKPVTRQERRSGNRKSLQCDSIMRALAVWKDGAGLEELVIPLLELPVMRARKVGDQVKEDGGGNIKQCLRKVTDGHYTAAVKVLCSSGVAPAGEDTLSALIDKHPMVDPPTMPSVVQSDPALRVDVDCVLECIKTFPKGTSCGRDGLRAQHILDAFCGQGSPTASGVLKAITDVVNLWLGGLCPKVLAEFIASAPLIPLLKQDNGIRPIAVGAIWRRLVSKVAMRKVGKEVAAYLGDFQFGVGVPNGAEAVLHSANRFLSAFHSDGSLAMLTVDFSNAFNEVDRTTLLREVSCRCPSIFPWVQFLYAQPARLYVGDTHIGASSGVQQGDPLGPLLFALVLHPLILSIQGACSLPFHAWYLDDGTIIGKAEEVARALDIIRSEGPSLGLRLNIRKTEIFWPSCNGLKKAPGLFPSDISRPVGGVKLLGGAVSRDAGFIQSLATKRALRAVELMKRLPDLRDPQSELLLLRSCMGVAKLVFGLRTCQPQHVKEAVSVFDAGLRGAVEDIVVCGGPHFGDLQWRLVSFPMRCGGLGIFSAEDVSTFAFVASRAQSWKLQNHILRSAGVVGVDPDYSLALGSIGTTLPDLDIGGFTDKETAPKKPQQTLANALYSKHAHDMEERFNMTPRQRAVLACLKGAHAQDFLTVVPIEGLGQRMSAIEYKAILKYRLMIPLFPSDEPCPICKKTCLDSFGEHALHCKELPGFKYRHDWVRDVLYDVLRRAGISAKKEAPVNFLTDPREGRSTLRPADVLVFGWAGGKHACVDLTRVSPLVGLRDSGFVPRQAVLRAESKKVAKHETACLENQHVFIPFAFDTFGSLAPEAVRFLERVQKVVHSDSQSPRNQGFVFSRIGFAIQKGIAAQLVARLPIIRM
ncbi:hypothetical protein QVD17_37932 [Tagetes erecta]|uniref:Reverse transcriptase domain-containing protein n=1 Tax=Tagetes erecta TaxID=13708 RepID=A0AAD8JV48_TARER|nr:hypothetical protein QVD17_37932 [Tagetes erecta]